MKQRRWICPHCKAGKLAPQRPRKNDVRRYCLPCSEKTGRLVERTCPAVDAQRSQRAERRSAKLKQRKGKERESALAYPVVLKALAQRWACLEAWEADLRRVRVTIRKSREKRLTSGRTRYGEHVQIHLTAGWDAADAVGVLLHEMAHAAGRLRLIGSYEGHCEVFWATMASAVYEVTGERVLWLRDRQKIRIGANHAIARAIARGGIPHIMNCVPSAPRSGSAQLSPHSSGNRGALGALFLS